MHIEDEMRMKAMGMMQVLANCRVYCPPEQQEEIDAAIEDNLPEGWVYKIVLDSGDLYPAMQQ